jgi:hypothetical protein
MKVSGEPGDPNYPLNRRIGGPQSQTGSFGEERNLCP